MQAASAVILAFPRRVPSAAADELELLPEHRLTSELAEPSRAGVPAVEAGRPMVVVLYSAALTADPWLQRAAGVSPLLSVPPLMLGLLRCWHLGQSGRLGSNRPDPWTFAAAAAWAGMLVLTVAHPSL
jgi:hypothetical protein